MGIVAKEEVPAKGGKPFPFAKGGKPFPPAKGGGKKTAGKKTAGRKGCR